MCTGVRGVCRCEGSCVSVRVLTEKGVGDGSWEARRGSKGEGGKERKIKKEIQSIL